MLRRAAVIVDGDRDKTHGNKERSFTAIGALWTAYLRNRKDPNASVEGSDVCAMMVLLKFARAHHGTYTEDHSIDAAGYAAIWGEVKESETKPKDEPNPFLAGHDPNRLYGPGQRGLAPPLPITVYDGILDRRIMVGGQ